MSPFTIGEVLNRLKDEFDDITISKIRFLESEGLISPDRTESGYRKFTEADVERLRYILRAQRDRYLPLKVIGEELDEIDARGGSYLDDAAASTPTALDGSASSTDGQPRLDLDPGEEAGGAGAAPTGLTVTELASRSGLTDREVAELRDHGLIGDPEYDEADLAVAEAAATLLRDGLEVRHLRMYRQFADREAAVVEQLITPLLRQRNPKSRRGALDQAGRLVDAGGSLHRALLTRQLRTLLTP